TSRSRHTRSKRDWSSDVCSSDLEVDRKLLTPFVEQMFETTVIEVNQLESIRHIFSHIIWSIDVFHFKVKDFVLDDLNQRFIPLDQVEDYPFPVPHQKVIDQL